VRASKQSKVVSSSKSSAAKNAKRMKRMMKEALADAAEGDAAAAEGDKSVPIPARTESRHWPEGISPATELDGAAASGVKDVLLLADRMALAVSTRLVWPQTYRAVLLWSQCLVCRLPSCLRRGYPCSCSSSELCRGSTHCRCRTSRRSPRELLVLVSLAALHRSCPVCVCVCLSRSVLVNAQTILRRITFVLAAVSGRWRVSAGCW
jgi:hypothetical protein